MLLVDTSVWSLALRRDAPTGSPYVSALLSAIDGDDVIVTTGLVVQELLQGFHGPRDRDQILDRFSSLPLITPDREDHIAAAEIRNKCRRVGVQLGTIDALLAQLAIRWELVLLTADQDFSHASKHIPLEIWAAK